MLHLCLVGLDSNGAVLVEAEHGFGQEARALDKVVGDYRHENVKLKVALAGGETDRRVVSHNLNGDHRDGLALGGVDFSRHDRRAGLVFRNADFSKAVARARSKPANIVGDLHHVGGQSLDGAVGEHQLVLACKRVELVGRGDKILSGQLRDALGDFFVKALGRVQAGAHGGSAKSELLEVRQRAFEHFAVALKAGSPAGDFLSERNRNRVLQVGAAALYDFHVFFFKLFESRCKSVDRGEELVFDRVNGGNVERRGERVV